MNWLDKLIAGMAPERALRRELARAQLERLASLHGRRGYEGAKIGGRQVWTSASSSANTEIEGALVRLRARSHDLVRNNPHASRAIASLVGNSIGTGFMVKLPKNLRPYWNNWTEYCDADGQLDYYGLQNLIGRTTYEAGECLVRLRQRLPSDGYEIPLQLQVLEPDYIDDSKNGEVSGGGWVWNGIQFNALGQRTGYWLFPEHPGDVAMFRRRSLESKFVPAEYVQHIYEKLRPGQARGVPRLASAMMRMRDLDDYEEAELVRKGFEACFGAFVIGGDSNRPLAQLEQDPQSGKRIETVSAGMVAYLNSGEDVKFGQPSAMGGYGEYTRAHLQAIAAGTGVTYEAMTGDLSQVNFTSHRAGLLEFRRLIECWQWLTFVPMHGNPTVRAWERQARIAGKIRGAAPIQIGWTPPKWDWVDPKKEVGAVRDEIAGGLSSLSEKLRARGFDPETVYAEIGSDVKALAEAAGIPREVVFKILFQADGAAAAPDTGAPGGDAAAAADGSDD